MIAIRGSHHLGALSLAVEPFAAEGLVALSFINSIKAVVPHGGHRAVFGTNAMAFATPRSTFTDRVEMVRWLDDHRARET